MFWPIHIENTYNCLYFSERSFLKESSTEALAGKTMAGGTASAQAFAICSHVFFFLCWVI